MLRRQNGFSAAIWLISLSLLISACAGGQATRDLVKTEYFLEQAGFDKWDVNDTTPKRQALLNSIPRGKISTFERGGVTYHAYTDEAAQRLYVGDEAAYQKFLSMSQGRKLCERVVAPDSSHFWSCYDEYQALGGRGQRGK